MAIDQTVPGGRYLGANGVWHDANGKPLPAPEPEKAPEPVVEPEPEPVVEIAPEPEKAPEPVKSKAVKGPKAK